MAKNTGVEYEVLVKEIFEQILKYNLANLKTLKIEHDVYIKGNARGTLGSEGGIRLVGETGPELRVLNQGDGIIPSEATKNLMEWGKISPKESATSKVSQFFFDKLVLPNVTDLMSLQQELKNFNRFSFQH